MTAKKIGWIFVGIQFIIIVPMILLPDRTDWALEDLSKFGGYTIMGLGAVIMTISAIALGPSLTASPEPKGGGELITNGLYRFVRHPIYTGLLIFLSGYVLKSRSFWVAGLFIVFSVFLHFKANWEEKRLIAVYPEYSDYMKTTGRILPWL